MELLCVLFFALLVVTLVGHGIWVACAAILRLFAEPKSERPLPAFTPARHDPLDDIDVALRQLRGLLSRGELDPETAGRAVEALLARRAALAGEEAPAVVETVRVTPRPLPAPPPSPVLTEVLDAVPAGEECPPPTPEPVPAFVPEPPPPRRSLRELLSGFLEERNILWGELVGGMLIVGCSIALVLTLWGSLQSLPYFPFLAFAALTAALFGAGQYTLHHWKLASTSRGLLLISLLLVPLNLLVLADPSARGAEPGPAWVGSAVDVAALGLLAALVHHAATSLIGAGLLPGPVDRRWLLALGVVGVPGSQLLAQHLFDVPLAGPTLGWLCLAGAAVGCHLLAHGAVLGGLTVYGARDVRLSREQAHAAFSFLGLATFALVATFGFLLTRLAAPADGLTSLAAPLTLGGVPAVALGLLVARRLADDQPAATRTAGTGVALGGLAAMLAGVVLAWPAPGPVVLTLLLTGVTLTAAAFAARAPWAHAGGVPALALAAVVGYHLLSPWSDVSAGLLPAVTSAQSGLVLAGVGVLLAAFAARLTQVEQGDALARGALTVGAAALLVATAHGIDHPLKAAVVHGVCAVAVALATLRWPRASLAHLAAVLVVPGTLWALWGTYPGQPHLWGLVLACEALVLQLAGWWLTRKGATLQGVAGDRAALLAGAVAAALPLSAGLYPPNLFDTGTAVLLAVAMFTRGGAGWFVGGQLALVAATVLGVTWWAEPRGWLADPRGWHAYGLGLGGLWLAAELARRRWPSLPWEPFRPGVDRALGGVLITGHLLVAGTAAWGAGLQEWGLIHPEMAPLHLAVIAAPAGWLLTLLLALPPLVALRGPAGTETRDARQGAAVELILLAVCLPLLYATWHTFDLAGASAARWALAACFLAGMALTWGREGLASAMERLGFVAPEGRGAAYTLFTGVAVAVVALTAVLTGLGFSGRPLPGPGAESPFARMGPTTSSIGPLLLVVAGLVGTAVRERWPGYALAAGLLLPASVMGGYALGVVQAGRPLDAPQLLFTVLLGCQATAYAALAWLAGARRVGGGELLGVQSALGLFGLALICGFARWPSCSLPGPGRRPPQRPRRTGRLGGARAFGRGGVVVLPPGAAGRACSRRRLVGAVGRCARHVLRPAVGRHLAVVGVVPRPHRPLGRTGAGAGRRRVGPAGEGLGKPGAPAGPPRPRLGRRAGGAADGVGAPRGVGPHGLPRRAGGVRPGGERPHGGRRAAVHTGGLHARLRLAVHAGDVPDLGGLRAGRAARRRAVRRGRAGGVGHVLVGRRTAASAGEPCRLLRPGDRRGANPAGRPGRAGRHGRPGWRGGHPRLLPVRLAGGGGGRPGAGGGGESPLPPAGPAGHLCPRPGRRRADTPCRLADAGAVALDGRRGAGGPRGARRAGRPRLAWARSAARRLPLDARSARPAGTRAALASAGPGRAVVRRHRPRPARRRRSANPDTAA
ncbi:MAG: hypothetical protein U0797_23765 [Gemmataceae bacterium]